ncbi:MAG: DUF1425 domain-containing protein [Parvibaculales bacterium]
MKNFVQSFTVIIVCGVLAACATGPVPDWQKNLTYRGAKLKVENIKLTNSQKAGKTLLIKAKVKQPSSAAKSGKVKYRVIWYDVDGQPIKSILSDWKQAYYKTGTYLEIQQVAPNPNVVGYRVEIKD